MNTSKRYFPEVQGGAMRMVLEHEGEHASQWAAIGSVAEELGCTVETLRRWVRQAERNQGRRPGLTTEECDRPKALVLMLCRYCRTKTRKQRAYQ